MFVHFSLRPATPSHALQQAAPNLYFGNLAAAHHHCLPDAAMVHACKHPCHQQAVGGSTPLDKMHPHYLHYEQDRHLYLNMIDPPTPLFRLESFSAFFAFADTHITQCPLVIHCNQGMSRAPSLALLYMSKRLNLLPNDSYEAARKAFTAQFSYQPGAGIAEFLSRHWEVLGA